MNGTETFAMHPLIFPGRLYSECLSSENSIQVITRHLHAPVFNRLLG